MAEVQYDVIVVGAGPAGSTLATLLAKKNRRVLILEQEKFPRYHIGESLAYGVVPILKELGVLEKVDAHGFTKKYGGTYVWGQVRDPWDFEWGDYPGLGADIYTYQVSRSEFDNILLRHAESLGVDVREEHRVVKVLLENERCVGVKYQNSNEDIFEVRARYVVDATGQSALFGNSFKMIEHNPEFKNAAFWSYYKNAQRQEGRKAGNVYIECTPKGWLWFIPLEENLTSVGLVATPQNLKNFQEKDVQAKYLEGINSTRETKRFLENAERIDKVHTIRDWSYQCKNFYGSGFLIVGDAAGFVDPLFATGVFLAMNGGSLGAKILDEALKHPQNEAKLLARYESAYQKFLGAVLSFVQHFYDSSRELSSYFKKAKDLVDPFSNLADKEDFVFLISGLHGVYLSEHEKIVAEGLDEANSLDKTERMKEHINKMVKEKKIGSTE